MVKSFKYIITRVIIGVLIALILMYFKGGLISNVSALEVKTFSTTNNTNFVSCSHCNVINEAWSFSSGLSNVSGILLINAQVTTNASTYPSTFVLARITIDGTAFNCNINGYGNLSTQAASGSSSTTQTGISTYSLSCPVRFGDNGQFQRIYLQVNGTTPDSISVYSPMTFVYDNGNQEVIDAIDENTDAQNETNDTLKSEDAPDTEGLFSDIDTDDSNSPVSDLITMPITLLQALNNNSSGSCTTWNLGTLLGKNLTMPCINVKNIVGADLYNIIDMAICLFLAYNLGLMCITIYNNLTSLNDDFDSMYAPKHEEHGKHGRVE